MTITQNLILSLILLTLGFALDGDLTWLAYLCCFFGGYKLGDTLIQYKRLHDED